MFVPNSRCLSREDLYLCSQIANGSINRIDKDFMYSILNVLDTAVNSHGTGCPYDKITFAKSDNSGDKIKFTRERFSANGEDTQSEVEELDSNVLFAILFVIICKFARGEQSSRVEVPDNWNLKEQNVILKNDRDNIFYFYLMQRRSIIEEYLRLNCFFALILARMMSTDNSVYDLMLRAVPQEALTTNFLVQQDGTQSQTMLFELLTPEDQAAIYPTLPKEVKNMFSVSSTYYLFSFFKYLFILISILSYLAVISMLIISMVFPLAPLTIEIFGAVAGFLTMTISIMFSFASKNIEPKYASKPIQDGEKTTPAEIKKAKLINSKSMIKVFSSSLNPHEIDYEELSYEELLFAAQTGQLNSVKVDSHKLYERLDNIKSIDELDTVSRIDLFIGLPEELKTKERAKQLQIDEYINFLFKKNKIIHNVLVIFSWTNVAVATSLCLLNILHVAGISTTFLSAFFAIAATLKLVDLLYWRASAFCNHYLDRSKEITIGINHKNLKNAKTRALGGSGYLSL
ncbi:MAG: hypothetical protein LBJ93_04435 [Clostridiales bacterium]|jgi:hypothetical protein|nr:hypothetical protein [Clostridiales bacterium]